MLQEIENALLRNVFIPKRDEVRNGGDEELCALYSSPNVPG
jgi:hypothetical protein